MHLRAGRPWVIGFHREDYLILTQAQTSNIVVSLGSVGTKLHQKKTKHDCMSPVLRLLECIDQSISCTPVSRPLNHKFRSYNTGVISIVRGGYAAGRRRAFPRKRISADEGEDIFGSWRDNSESCHSIIKHGGCTQVVLMLGNSCMPDHWSRNSRLI